MDLQDHFSTWVLTRRRIVVIIRVHLRAVGRESIMKSFLFTLSLLFFTSLVRADMPSLQPGVPIKDGTKNLEVNLYSAPTWADWNNDGAKDLIVGQIMNGYVWLYLNQGTDLNPVFNGGAMIESGGTPISVTWG
jgi:hypothetical protein